MQILIILLLFLLLSALIPILLPIISIAAIIVLGLNLRRMFSPDNYKKFNQENTRKNIFERQEDSAPPEGSFRQGAENSDAVYERPTSVRDDAFWEQNHTVYDVPFEEALPTEKDEESHNN